MPLPDLQLEGRATETRLGANSRSNDNRRRWLCQRDNRKSQSDGIMFFDGSKGDKCDDRRICLGFGRVKHKPIQIGDSHSVAVSKHSGRRHRLVGHSSSHLDHKRPCLSQVCNTTPTLTCHISLYHRILPKSSSSTALTLLLQKILLTRFL